MTGAGVAGSEKVVAFTVSAGCCCAYRAKGRERLRQAMERRSAFQEYIGKTSQENPGTRERSVRVVAQL
jgi:hypothetical protein